MTTTPAGATNLDENSEGEPLTLALCLPGRGPRGNYCHAAYGWGGDHCDKEIAYHASLVYCCGDEECVGPEKDCSLGIPPESNHSFVCADHAISLRVYWHNLEWIRDYQGES